MRNICEICNTEYCHHIQEEHDAYREYMGELDSWMDSMVMGTSTVDGMWEDYLEQRRHGYGIVPASQI